jgi:hypothetical protein
MYDLLGELHPPLVVPGTAGEPDEVCRVCRGR